MVTRRSTDEESFGPVETATPDLLRRTAELAIAYRRSLPERPVGVRAGTSAASLEASIGGPLPRVGRDAMTVV
jgi:hypothetical protein